MTLFSRINFKGDAVAAFATFFLQGVVKFGSSLILTRILQPEAYGVVAIMMSVAFTLVMLADLGTHVCVVRAPDGDTPAYLNTAWTMKFARSLTNAGLVFLLAPVFAKFYGMPVLVAPLRWFALWFLIDGLESNAFLVATRRKNTRIVVYSDLAANIVGTLASIAFSLMTRDFWGMVFGIMVNRGVYVLLSYAFYRDLWPRIRFDRRVAREIFQFTRVSMPSSILTLVLSQFDKAVFPRFFDLRLLGLYGLAGNLAGQLDALAGKVNEMVVFPRCAHAFRTDLANFSSRFYAENLRVFVAVGTLIGGVGGAADLIVALLYDPRYHAAAGILRIITIRCALGQLFASAQSVLVAAGQNQIFITGSIISACSLVVAAALGIYLGGLNGFVAGLALSGLPTLLYYFWVQRKIGALVIRFEVYKLAYIVAVGVVVYLLCNWFQGMFHVSRMHL